MMPSDNNPVSRPKKQMKGWLLVLVIICAVASGGVAGAFVALTKDLPQIRSLEEFTPAAVTRVYASDDVLIAELFGEKRRPIPLSEIPPQLVTALLATEDRKFYEHSGVDVQGILRAVVKDIIAGEFVEGASTLTQQLSKTLFLTPRKTITRKIREAILAFQLERRYTKDEILALYLNQVYFGSGAYGVESAARTFFGKPASALTLAECALIAGLPKAPSRYSPLVDPQLAKQRRDTVLRQMRDIGAISDTTYQTTIRQPVTTVERPADSRRAPYFIDYITPRLEQIIGQTRLYTGGLRIMTTLDSRLQEAAQKACDNGMSDLDKRIKRRGKHPVPAQVALVAIDTRTGGIVAMCGGRDYRDSPFNRAVDARRQPGSAFKPLVYAYAIEKGFEQNRLILDAPVVFEGARKAQSWSPRNFSNSYSGEMTLRRALTLSKNIPAVRLIDTLGPARIADFAHRLGISSPLAPNLSLALGTSEVTLLELTGAYAAFPNGGRWVEPHGLMTVVDRHGETLWRSHPEQRIAMQRRTAAIITDMLIGVIQEGTGKRARHLGRSVGGKTGTTDDYRDALFVGFSPTIAAGVWVGFDQPASLGPYETGARAALPVWMAFMKSALATESNQYFDRPDGLVRVSIDPVTGRRSPENAPGSIQVLLRDAHAGTG